MLFQSERLCPLTGRCRGGHVVALTAPAARAACVGVFTETEQR